jgi:hypothetical protein
MKPKVEAAIDELYKLPLDEFTKARNTLAKTLDGSDKKTVATLPKPSLPAWMVNQLYWHDASTYRALVDASEKLRAAHRAALSGRDVDTRKPDELHRTTIEKALAKALALAERRSISVSDAARDALRRTLAALPVDEAAGRLTHEPPPAGFSLLTGVKPAPADAKRERKPDQKLSREAAAIQKAAERRAEQERKDAQRKAFEQQLREKKDREKREREIRKAEEALREAERRLAQLKG